MTVEKLNVPSEKWRNLRYASQATNAYLNNSNVKQLEYLLCARDCKHACIIIDSIPRLTVHGIVYTNTTDVPLVIMRGVCCALNIEEV